MKILFSALLSFLIINLYLVTPILAAQATLSLSPSTGTFGKGCQFTVDIKLNTGGAATDGTDAIITYDPTRLSTNTNSIASGTIYPDYPGNNVDEQNGKITVSGLSSVTSAFSGSGNLATVTFSVKPEAPEGLTTIKFDFDANDKAKTTDSNVVERGTVSDILSSVVNGSYTITSGGCTGGAVKTGIGGTGGVGTPSGTIDDGFNKKILPDSGTSELTYTIAIVGSILAILGVLGLALL